MKTQLFAALALAAVRVAQAAPPQAMTKQSELDDLSLEELLALRESILEAKLNLTYYIEESDDVDDEDQDEEAGDDQEDDDGQEGDDDQEDDYDQEDDVEDDDNDD